MIDISKQKDWKIAKDGDYIYIYNGQYWVPFIKDDIIYFLEQFAIKAGVSIIDAADEQFLEKLYKQLQKESYFNNKNLTNKNLINLQNGTFDITTLQLKGFDYQDFLTYQLPYPYKEGATNTLWEKFLDEVLPDKETQRTLQEVLGSIFIKDIKLEYIFFLYGKGQNGKSVVMEILTALLGKENISNFSLDQLMEEHNRAMIKDKLVNFGSETDLKKINPNIFKALASNEPIQARLKYGNSFMMEDYAKLIFNVNKFQFNDIEHTEGFFRRFLIIPFDVKIPDEKVDRKLHLKIINAGMEGVLNWIIEGATRVIENEDIFISDKCKIARDKFFKEIDNVRQFIEDNGYQPSIYNRMKASELYGEYRNYCAQNNFKSVSSRTFKERLQAIGIEWKKFSDTNYYLIEKK
ncbi:putative DNA primase/helicase [Nitratiruptor sp. YY08-26]|uniref:DNA primase family protein n=1 Tax=unclassified Nitratiruptor TaxID=2624044 RepID=UPI0019169420|nr:MULTISPECIES: DNA primase family protein [unclassified Nitratiruptor]BCD62640.1 putative DNA primase/helicase [Nitratiruptor sp. YY08-13]BCD66576.1 putative DNA primase/helicase [Nitratiruptor sp. YY08-26]